LILVKARIVCVDSNSIVNYMDMQVHEPLLDAELGLRGAESNAQVWRGTIDNGAMATLTLNPDGSFQLKEVE
jgi:hypothetical protein